MRSKIIIVNVGIILLIGFGIYALLATMLGDAVSNPAERKAASQRALRSANAQIALDGLRYERWLAARAAQPDVKKVFSLGTPDARSDAATTAANKLIEAAAKEPEFSKMAPSLVVFVDDEGVGLGRNGSNLMRGDKLGEAYPNLLAAMKNGVSMSDLWSNRKRQEQLLASFAPVRDDEGNVVGAIVIGAPLNDERLARISEMTSGTDIIVAMSGNAGLESLASSGKGGAVLDALQNDALKSAAAASLKSGSVNAVDEALAGHRVAVSPLEGYNNGGSAVMVAAVPASLVPSLNALLWPVFAVCGLGVLMVIVGGFLLGNYISRPVGELEEGLLAIMNGQTQLRFEMEHAELGGLVFRINSLLNAMMGVEETDEDGRPSRPAGSPEYTDQ